MFVITKDDINSKAQFVAALRKFLKTGQTTIPQENGREYNASAGELTLIHAIADYFEAHTEIRDESGIGFWYDVLKHIADAFHEFQTDPRHEQLRSIYKGQTEGAEIPDLFDIRHGRARARVIFDLGRFLPLIAGRMDEGIGERAEGYFNCQQQVVEAAWRVFVRQCYRSIAPVIRKSKSRSHQGLFGRTTLSVDTMAGRAQYMFERPTSVPDSANLFEKVTAIVDTPGSVAVDKYAAIEAVLMTRRPAKRTHGAYEISFVADESDMIGFRAGMNTPGSAISDYKACVEMIEDVVAHWDMSKLVAVDE